MPFHAINCYYYKPFLFFLFDIKSRMGGVSKGWGASLLLPPANEVSEGYVFTPVSHSVHKGGGVCVVAWGACVVAGRVCVVGGACMAVGGCGWGCAWLLGGMCGWGVHGCRVGAAVCMVAGGHAWLGGACVVAGGHVWWWGGACVGYDEIRSMSGRYASYWNASQRRP